MIFDTAVPQNEPSNHSENGGGVGESEDGRFSTMAEQEKHCHWHRITIPCDCPSGNHQIRVGRPREGGVFIGWSPAPFTAHCFVNYQTVPRLYHGTKLTRVLLKTPLPGEQSCHAIRG